MEHIFSKENLLQIAGECSLLSRQERPEQHWLNTRYLLLKSRLGFRLKSETDRYICEQIFAPDTFSPADVLKIRYWRTGLHVPVSRDLCRKFGEVLELSPHDMELLMLSYFDKSLYVYSDDCKDSDVQYQNKLVFMRQLTESYLSKIPDSHLNTLKIPANRKNEYLRHLYFTDAANYVSTMKNLNPVLIQKHINSASYGTELHRTLNLQDEIPRKTMIRHLLILGMPDITLDWLNQQLHFLDYLPLTPEHTMVTGERLDLLLIQLITLYEKYCNQYGKAEALLWMQESCRILDEYFVKQDQKRLRFMHFKALKDSFTS